MNKNKKSNVVVGSPFLRKLKGAHVCYVLRSVNYPQRAYIGYTNNPAARIRKHNREIKGGARKTAHYRPWHMMYVITGFHGHIEALQFEWALQHAYKSIHFKALRPAGFLRKGDFKSKERLLEYILAQPRWHYLRLFKKTRRTLCCEEPPTILY
jgi:predicted GIY-YIG superfamily endonuclease